MRELAPPVQLDLRRLERFAVRDLARTCALFVIHAQAGAPIDLALLERCLPELLQETPNPKAGPLLWDGVSYAKPSAASSAS